ncbi:cob(I)yrinic acid a,c-diamide adenosyltransferase [Aminobacterium mobile]|uniref:cob(I)yrinic acid a,c-diamide adenosyltransferase n=1 Tax=Aminobacterium mobile TaxID=81467 RepID=UPI0004BC2C4A|nr:cob(I)yrinic acid a,c-diamide adenosyltransferase [Aminobacterium mobile]
MTNLHSLGILNQDGQRLKNKNKEEMRNPYMTREHSEELGLVQIYMGDGKGKTTAALGLALRAAGWGFTVGIVQFMKGWPHYGELVSLSRIPEIKIIQTGRPDFVDKTAPLQVDFLEAQRGLEIAEKWIMGGQFNIVILDEINVALDYGLLKAERLLALLKKRTSHVEVVLTGRNPPQILIDYADLVTEMKEIRHPFQKGIYGRKGVEY